MFKNELKNFWVKEEIQIIVLYFISRLAIFFIGYLSTLIIIKGKWWDSLEWPLPPLLDVFFLVDSGWFIEIAQMGYSYTPGEQSSVACFPLYPLLIKIFSYIIDPVIAGYIISNIAFLLACLFLYKLIQSEFTNKELAFKAVFFMLIFPTSFYASIVYSEGLFLFLSIASFYYARKKSWLTASLFGFFAALTRSIGFLLFIPLLIEYLEIDFKGFKVDLRKIKKEILYLFLVPAGIFLYALYLKVTVGSFWSFIAVQSAWGMRLADPLSTLSNLSNYPPFHQIIFFLFPLSTLLLIVYLGFKKISLSYLLYSFLLLFAFLSTDSLWSIHRYIGVIFPLYIALPMLAQKNKATEYILITFSIMFLTIFIILFVNGYLFF